MADNIVSLVTRRSGMTQAELANELGVSRAQITKWKNGDDLPPQRRAQMLELISMSEEEFDWLPFTTNPEEIPKWIAYLRGVPCEGYEYFRHGGIEDFMLPGILAELRRHSIKIPVSVPTEDEDDEEDSFYCLLIDVFSGAGRLAYFTQKYIGYDQFCTHLMNLDTCLVGLSLAHIDTETYAHLIEDISAFRERSFAVRVMANEIIHELCRDIIAAGRPIAADYFGMVNRAPDDLVDEEDDDPYFFPKTSLYFSYPEATLSKQIIELREIVFELHRKIDCLLTPHMKIALEPGITITKPFYPQRPDERSTSKPDETNT